MLTLVTLDDFNIDSLKPFIKQLRRCFASVFSQHYSELLWRALDESNISKKKSTLAGFSDLIRKYLLKKEIAGLSIEQLSDELKTYSKDKIQSTFYQLYFGAGFDDEVVFLLEHNPHLKSYLSAALLPDFFYQENYAPSFEQELQDYQTVLAKEGRTLREVNLLALVSENGTVHGFAIYHVFRHNDELILHVRQSAMREQGRGYAHAFAHYFAEHYRGALYEANQRRANHVPMKEVLLNKGLVQSDDAVLGYATERYLSISSIRPIADLLFSHYHSSNDPRKKYLIKRSPYFRDAESFQVTLFSKAQLVRELTSDDCYLQAERNYLRSRRV